MLPAEHFNPADTTIVNPQKGKALLYGLAGTTYEHAILMRFAFEAYRDGTEFILYAECEEFEKFDDIVIIYSDHIKALQAKHSYDPGGYYELKDFTSDPKTKGKKVQLSKYFDSWHKVKQKLSNEPRPCVFTIYSNHVLNPSGVLNSCWNTQTKKFNDNFINGTNLNVFQIEARNTIFNAIRQHSKVLQKISYPSDIALLNSVIFIIDGTAMLKFSQDVGSEINKFVSDHKTTYRPFLTLLLKSQSTYFIVDGQSYLGLPQNFLNVNSLLFQSLHPTYVQSLNMGCYIISPQKDGINDNYEQIMNSAINFQGQPIIQVTTADQVAVLANFITPYNGNYILTDTFKNSQGLNEYQVKFRQDLIEQLKTLHIESEIIKFMNEFTLQLAECNVTELKCWLKHWKNI